MEHSSIRAQCGQMVIIQCAPWYVSSTQSHLVLTRRLMSPTWHEIILSSPKESTWSQPIVVDEESLTIIVFDIIINRDTMWRHFTIFFYAFPHSKSSRSIDSFYDDYNHSFYQLQINIDAYINGLTFLLNEILITHNGEFTTISTIIPVITYICIV